MACHLTTYTPSSSVAFSIAQVRWKNVFDIPQTPDLVIHKLPDHRCQTLAYMISLCLYEWNTCALNIFIYQNALNSPLSGCLAPLDWKTCGEQAFMESVFVENANSTFAIVWKYEWTHLPNSLNVNISGMKLSITLLLSIQIVSYLGASGRPIKKLANSPFNNCQPAC